MRVHHLNCATFCPRGRRLLHGRGGLLERGRLTCHCLLLETSRGLVLVDTGLGTQDLSHPHRNLGVVWPLVMRPALDPRETALHLVRALGYEAADVTAIVLTHLDFDHAGGLADFPRAEVHVSGREHEVVGRRLGWWERRRYVPAQWAHGPVWRVHAPAGERWMGFDAVRALPGNGDEVLLVPLEGHSRGHCGVAVRTAGGWLLHAGDAYFHHAEVDPAGDRGPIGVKMYQAVYQSDARRRTENQARLRELVRTEGRRVRVVNSHDPVYLGPAGADLDGEEPGSAPGAPGAPPRAAAAGPGAGGTSGGDGDPASDRCGGGAPGTRGG